MTRHDRAFLLGVLLVIVIPALCFFLIAYGMIRGHGHGLIVSGLAIFLADIALYIFAKKRL